MEVSGVYMWRCIPENKCYIGQAVNLSKRYRQFLNFGYRYSTKQDKPSGVDKARILFPEEKCWEYKVLCECDKSMLDLYEELCIAIYKANNLRYGYNQTKGGTTGTKGYKHTETTRDIIAKKQRAAALRRSPEERKKAAIHASSFVVRDNPEYRHKLSEALMGHTETQETKDKIRKSQEVNFKPVIRISKDNIPKKFDCIMDAVRSIMREDSKEELNRCKAAVGNCLRNKNRTKTARGYKFIYA